MADFKGGRGKKTGYETQMYRIPTPLKPVVEAMGMQFRLLWGGLIDPKGEDLIARLETAIADPSQFENANPNNLISRLSELEAKLADCQQENSALKQRLSDVVARLSQATTPKWKRGDYDTGNTSKLVRIIEEVLAEVKKS